MNAWAVNIRNLEIRTGIIAIEGKRRPGIKSGDSVILFQRKGDHSIVFTCTGTVTDADSGQSEDGTFWFKSRLADRLDLKPPRELADFVYSLLKVYRHSAPGRHFRNPYTSLKAADYATLDQARIFWARTAFGVFISQIPEPTLGHFVQYVAELDPRALIERSDFASLWSYLREFLESQFIGAHSLTEATAEIVDGLQKKGIDLSFDDLQLSDDKGDSRDSLRDQRQKLVEFVSSLQATGTEEQSLFDELDGRIEANAGSEAKFEELFGGTPWPMPPIVR